MEGALCKTPCPPPLRAAAADGGGVESSAHMLKRQNKNTKKGSYKEREKPGVGEADLCHLHLNRLDSILDPFTHSRMPTLTYGIVEFTSAQKGFAGVECTFKEYGVDGDGEEVAEGCEDSGVGV